MAVRQISNRKLLALGQSNSLFYRKGKLYIGDAEGQAQTFFCEIPAGRLRGILAKLRLTERLLRLEPRTACALPEGGFLLSCGGVIYRVDLEKQALYKELQLRPGMNNPLTFTRYHAGTTEEEILFGEYFSNNKNESVSIYRRKKGVWSRAYTFPADQIYHIHGIVADDAKGWVYVLTGDQDQQSAIWRTTDDFQTVESLLRGSQQYRSCVAFPTEEGLIYATDTPREQNWLYRLKEQEDGWKNEPVCPLPGPCIYGTRRQNGCCFATSVEGDDTLSPIRYRFSQKLGAGVQDRYCHLVFCDLQGQVREIAKLKKDMLPMLLFQFGNSTFPDMPMDAPLWCTPLSVNHYDGKTIEIECGE